ncbi:MAG: AAA family ATPase [Campylobacterota bacterium]
MSKQKKTEISKRYKIAIGVLSALIIILLLFAFARNKAEHISAAKANALIEKSIVSKAVIDTHYIYLYSKGQKYKTAKTGVNTATLNKQIPVSVSGDKDYLIDGLMILVIVAALIWLIRSMKKDRQKQLGEFQKRFQFAQEGPSSQTLMPQKSDVRFDDVAGIDEVKEELLEIIDFLKHPRRYLDFGVRMPRGVLLVGSPGVGKTMIAKAVAGEADVPFFYQSGAAFVQIYVGMGAKRVKELFEKAKSMSPSIIFIDEIDAVGKARGGARNDERESTLNQLLTEMDGFEDSSEVVVIAATNQLGMLDEALLRPGRFDRRVHVSLPNAGERKKIAKLYLDNKPNSVDLDLVADLTIGFSPAALSSLINEAALHALKEGKKAISNEDIISVKDKVIAGKKKVLTLSSEEKKIQATYQGAKALVASWFEVHFDKIGLISEHISGIEKEIISKNEMLGQVKVHLAGIVATKDSYGESFSNAKEDLAAIKQKTDAMLEVYGMSSSYGYNKAREQLQIITECEEEIKTLLIKLKPVHEKIIDHLLAHEFITNMRIKEIESEVF